MRTRFPIATQREGFSVVELLVVMATLSALIALVLPAVQSARESARSLECLNRLRQLGIALQNSESDRSRFPRSPFFSSASMTNRSLHLSLLPYLGLTNVYSKFNELEDGLGARVDPPASTLNAELLELRLPVFVCPSDPSPVCRNSYRVCAGTSPGLHVVEQPDGDNSHVGFMWQLGKTTPFVVDGRSQTVAIAEKLAGDGNPDHYTPWCDVRAVHPIPRGGMDTPGAAIRTCQIPDDAAPDHVSFGGSTWILSGFSQTWYNHVLTPNSVTSDCVDGRPEASGTHTARSLHRGSVNVMFADGSTRKVSQNIALDVWRGIGTTEAGETIVVDW